VSERKRINLQIAAQTGDNKVATSELRLFIINQIPYYTMCNYLCNVHPNEDSSQLNTRYQHLKKSIKAIKTKPRKIDEQRKYGKTVGKSVK